MGRKKQIQEEIKMEEDNRPKIIMGLDISTTCIGVCILEDDGSEYGKILELTHVNPKVPTKIKGIESLFLKKQIFNNEFLKKWEKIGIRRVIIESPLLRSNNVNTVSTLLQFNGMVSDCIYNVLGIVPEYISSYDARKFSFPEFMAVRKFGKNGELYEKNKIVNSIKKNQFVLFGAFPWDVEKKTLIQSKVSEIFTDINWLYDKNGELKKENFDACDAYVACLGFLNKEKFGEPNFEVSDIESTDDVINFNVKYWNKNENRKIYLNKKEG